MMVVAPERVVVPATTSVPEERREVRARMSVPVRVALRETKLLARERPCPGEREVAAVVQERLPLPSEARTLPDADA